jgi:hypothetical protein
MRERMKSARTESAISSVAPPEAGGPAAHARLGQLVLRAAFRIGQHRPQERRVQPATAAAAAATTAAEALTVAARAGEDERAEFIEGQLRNVAQE